MRARARSMPGGNARQSGEPHVMRDDTASCVVRAGCPGGLRVTEELAGFVRLVSVSNQKLGGRCTGGAISEVKA